MQNSPATREAESSEHRVAYGLAAEMAQSAPRLLFRNPDNVNKAYEIEKERHEQFVEHFGAPWIDPLISMTSCWREIWPSP